MTESLRHIDELGGHRAFNHYPWGWAWAGNAPLQLWKRYAWLGGVRTPLIAHWPGRLAGTGGGAAAVLPRGRPVLDGAGRGGRAAARRWSTGYSSSRSTGRASWLPLATRRRRARGGRSTSRCTARAASTTTAGKRRPTTSRRCSASAATSPAATTSTMTGGRCSTWTDDFAEARDLADAEPRQADGAA